MIESDEEEIKESNGVSFDLHEKDETIEFENSKLLNDENKDEVFENNNNGENKSRSESKTESNEDKQSVVSSSNSSLISCYLCIKVNKNKDFISCPMNRKMKNRLTSEFWFQINDNR